MALALLGVLQGLVYAGAITRAWMGSVDMTGDPALEDCVGTGGYGTQCYEAPGPAGPWSRLGTLRPPARAADDALLEELRRSGARTQPAEFRDVWIGERRFWFQPSARRPLGAPAPAR